MEEKLREDLKEIKAIMNRSTRFTALSGLSGVAAGIAALGGAFVARQTVFQGQGYFTYTGVELPREDSMYLLLIASGTLMLAALGALFFTSRKNRSQRLWNHQAKRFLINFSIPLLTGGLVCFVLLTKGMVGLLLPFSLLFYGLGLVNASRDTLPELRSLGLIEIFLGLVALQFIGYGLLLWAIGFGLMHIVFGLMVQWKYKP